MLAISYNVGVGGGVLHIVIYPHIKLYGIWLLICLANQLQMLTMRVRSDADKGLLTNFVSQKWGFQYTGIAKVES